MDIHDVEVAIIGSGTAGMAAYRQVRKRCERIALIEGGPFGTTCARVGCMPSKLLIAPAEARHRLQALPEFGIHIDNSRVDGSAVMRRVREERDRFVGFVLEAVGTFDPAHVVRGYATFEDPHTLKLSPAFDGSSPPFKRIRAERIVIAAGSRPRVPDAFKAAGDRLISSDDVFDWQDLPASVAVFGAGVIGLELGQALHRLGVRVRLFGQDGKIGGTSDPAIRSYAAKVIGNELPISLHAQDVRIERDFDHVVVHFRDPGNAPNSERFEFLLAATGRMPNLDRIALENSGLALDARGKPSYDPQTTRAGDSHIFIAGDANSDRPILHEANDEGHLAGQNAAVYPEVFRKARREPIGIVFCDPQIAFAGKRHSQLVADGVDFATGEVSFENQGRARVMLINRGKLHVYGERKSGLLLGAEMIGPQNEHLAHLLAWAMQQRMTVAEVIEMPFYHPVIEEGLRTALRHLLAQLGMAPEPPKNCIDCGPGG